MSDTFKSIPAWISFASGATAGLVDTCVNYPPYGLHYRVGRGVNIWERSKWRLYWTPRELYRGAFAYSAIIPITCMTDGLTDYLKSKGIASHIASFTSGIIAAMIVSAPAGNVIVTDQRLKESGLSAGFRYSVRNIWFHHGVRGFYTGLPSLMIREGIYSWAVFYVKSAIKNHFDTSDIKASIGAGTLAAILSQPTDTLTTYMQNQIKKKSTIESIKAMWREEGLKRFYRGFIFRWYAIIAGVYVMDKVSTSVKFRLMERFE